MELSTYGGFKPENRTQALELFAFKHMTGEDIFLCLDSVSPELAQEYNKLMEGA